MHQLSTKNVTTGPIEVNNIISSDDDLIGDWLTIATISRPKRLTDIRSWHGHIPFAFWCIDKLKPATFVELGTHKGDSYSAFCQAVKKVGTSTRCYAVDSWKGDQHSYLYEESVYEEFKKYHDENFSKFSSLVRSTFDEAKEQFEDGSIDLLHIDGFHTYEAVKNDFETWQNKLSNKAVVLFHDTNVRERDFGIWKYWEEIKQKYPSFLFTHSHGLGVLCVGRNVPESIKKLCNQDTEKSKQIADLFAELGESVLAISKKNSLAKEFKSNVLELSNKSKQLNILLSELQSLRRSAAKSSQLEKDFIASNAYTQELTNELKKIRSSSSWLITKPLRWFAIRLKRIISKRKEYSLAAEKALDAKLISEYREAEKRHARALEFAERASMQIPWRWYDAVKPKVSIIIIAYNKSEFTTECLRSVWSNTQRVPFEVIVIDNGSSEADIKRVKKSLAPARLLDIQVNRGFGEGNNIAAEYAKGDYILFLNNDVTVTPGWLENMVTVIEGQPKAGAVGAKLVYPDGKLQEAGSMVLKNGEVSQRGKHDDPSKDIYNNLEVVDYCSASCLLIKKDLFLKVGGFDHRYDPAYYEDTDLCLKIEALGFKTYYNPATLINHFEGATSRDAKMKKQLHNIVEVNRKKFMARWKQRIENGPGTLPENDFDPVLPRIVARNRNVTSKKALRIGLFSPYNISPGGGERYLLSLASIFKGIAEIELVTPNLWSNMRLQSVAKELSLDIGKLRSVSLDEAQNGKPYDIFYALGNQVVPPVYPLGKKSFFICQFPFPSDKLTIDYAKGQLVSYDGIFVYSEFVKGHLLEQIAEAGLSVIPKIEIVSPPVSLTDNPSVSKKSKVILHVGRFFIGGHSKKQLELVKTFKELIDTDQLKGWELHLAGGSRPEPENRAYLMEVMQEAKGYPINFHIDQPPSELAKLYEKASIYWHATGMGTDQNSEPEKQEHFGITTVEAMSAGCIPIVIASGGQTEIVEDKVNGFIWRDSEELKKVTLDVANNLKASRKEKIMHSAIARSQEFSEKVFSNRVKYLGQKAGVDLMETDDLIKKSVFKNSP